MQGPGGQLRFALTANAQVTHLGLNQALQERQSIMLLHVLHMSCIK